MGFLDPNSWAMAFDTSQEDAAKASQNTADRALDLQQQNYLADLQRNQPYYGSGVLANAYMQSLMTGKPATYTDPRYTQISGTEWRAPDGTTVKSAPTLTANYALGDLSPAGQWQLQQGNKTLNRALAARGLSGSGQAATALGDLGQNVAAQDYNNKWDRLLDMVKIGTGASAAAGGASQSYNNALGQNAAYTQNIQNNLANGRSSLYNTRAGLGSDTLNTGLKLYDYGKQSGWWGANGGGTTYDAGGANFSNGVEGSGMYDNYGDLISS